MKTNIDKFLPGRPAVINILPLNINELVPS